MIKYSDETFAVQVINGHTSIVINRWDKSAIKMPLNPDQVRALRIALQFAEAIHQSRNA